MNVLIIGSGAREHAIGKALSESSISPNIYTYASNNNPGLLNLSEKLIIGNLLDNTAIVNFATNNNITFCIIGPEGPLANGLVDLLEQNNIPTIGPKKNSAQIETSKSFTRNLLQDDFSKFMPAFKKFTQLDSIPDFLNQLNNNYAIKADGLMGGKGVKLSGEHLENHEQALAFCQEILDKKQNILIEEKLTGPEFSLISVTDGKSCVHMPLVKDHKRAYENDTGPNTGGMGTISYPNHSLPYVPDEYLEQAKLLNQQTINLLKNKTGETYKGFLYGGFMVCNGHVKLIEYNARLGDPEAMNLLGLLETDFMEICEALLTQSLHNINIKFKNLYTVCKYIVPNGYPDKPIKDFIELENNNNIYFAAIDKRIDERIDNKNNYYMTGSRAIAVLGMGESLDIATKQANKICNTIHGPVFYRKDIGEHAL